MTLKSDAKFKEKLAQETGNTLTNCYQSSHIIDIILLTLILRKNYDLTKSAMTNFVDNYNVSCNSSFFWDPNVNDH